MNNIIKLVQIIKFMQQSTRRHECLTTYTLTAVGTQNPAFTCLSTATNSETIVMIIMTCAAGFEG